MKTINLDNIYEKLLNDLEEKISKEIKNSNCEIIETVDLKTCENNEHKYVKKENLWYEKDEVYSEFELIHALIYDTITSNFMLEIKLKK